jgi:hypothetical protein
LSASEEFGGIEVLQGFVVCDDQDGVCGTFKVLAPGAEGIKDWEKLLVMDIVVQLGIVHRS